MFWSDLEHLGLVYEQQSPAGRKGGKVLQVFVCIWQAFVSGKEGEEEANHVVHKVADHLGEKSTSIFMT